MARTFEEWESKNKANPSLHGFGREVWSAAYLAGASALGVANVKDLEYDCTKERIPEAVRVEAVRQLGSLARETNPDERDMAIVATLTALATGMVILKE